MPGHRIGTGIGIGGDWGTGAEVDWRVKRLID